MTWSVTHTIPYDSNADNHSAMVYLFDTVLAGKTGWTISAHPDASAFKRRAQFTALNKVTNSNYTFYNWVSWFTTSPTSYTWYEDATYTTTPGDTANDATSNTSSVFSWTTQGESWKFCESSENSQSILVLKGGKVAFYWPGFTSGVFWPDTTWTAGNNDNKGTHIFPAVGWYYNTLSACNSPVSTSTSTERYNLIPDSGFGSNVTPAGFRLGGNMIATNFNWLYTTGTSTASPDNYSHVAFNNGGHNDVGVWLPSSVSASSDCRMPFAYSSNGITLQIGSDYWYNPYTDLSRQNVIFNFGATDPLA